MFLVSPAIDLAMRLGGPRFRFAMELRRTLRWHNAEREFYLLPQLVDARRAAVDVGANLGLYAGRLAHLCPRVHCFEPISWVVAALRRKLPRRVAVHGVAASDAEGSGVLRVPYRGDVEEHGTATLEAGNPLDGATRVHDVRCRLARLDDEVSEPVGFIKIDVEGHELAVLKGAARILRADRPTLLVESERRHNPAAPESIFAFLARFGYVPWVALDGGIVALDGFDVARDQQAANAGRRGQHYMNNFIFRPQS